MSFTDEGAIDTYFFFKDQLLPMFTPEAIDAELRHFALPLVTDRTSKWLALAVKRALSFTIESMDYSPERTSNTDIRSELEQLVGVADDAKSKFLLISGAAESRLWRYVFNRWDGKGGIDFGDGLTIPELTDIDRFKAIVGELEWVAGLLRDAADATASQRGPWRQSAEKQQRIERGQYLAPIYEAAFGEAVSANNFPNDARHKAPTAFMDFYSRMVILAFGARATANLSEVVKQACKLHRQQPAQFGKGIIPGL